MIRKLYIFKGNLYFLNKIIDFLDLNVKVYVWRIKLKKLIDFGAKKVF